jgi:Caspase domain
MRFVGAIVFAICLNVLFSQSASAEKRVALVIGNSGYQNVAHLANPANDAQLLADTLKTANFDPIISLRDLKTSEMRRALRAFADQVRDADVALVFYAGHGIEVDGINYLIPIDAMLERDIDVYDETFPLDRVLVTIEPAKRLRLVILDACRDNPFARTMKRTIAARAVGRGLAKVEPTSPNTLIAFAAKAGSTASDGDDKGSPFTTALVKHIATPGLDLRKAFGYVRDDVLKATNNRQEPYVYGSLGGDDVPLVPAKPLVVGPQPTPQSEVRRDFELALQTGDREAFEAFLRAYPTGFYADLANVQLKKIAAEEARRAAEAKARLAQQEKERLAAEEAKKAEQAKAAAKAKAAEAALLAAEKTSQIEAEKAAAVEQARTAAERIAAEKLSAESRVIDEPAARQPVAKETSNEQKLAALSSPTDKVEQQAAHDFARALQAELRRVGCNTGAVDGNWDANSQRALDLFNKHAGMKLETKIASADALDAVKSKTGRICPLVCDVGYKAEGDRCIKITCSAGYELSADGTCEKSRARKPTAKREKPKLDRPNTTVVDNSGAAPGKITRGGVTTCGPRGCQFVPKNCYAVSGAGGHGLGGKIFCQ